MKESKSMLEIRKIRVLEDKKMRKMSTKEMFKYMKERFTKNDGINKNLNLKPSIK